jgi:hypothetical protein
MRTVGLQRIVTWVRVMIGCRLRPLASVSVYWPRRSLRAASNTARHARRRLAYAYPVAYTTAPRDSVALADADAVVNLTGPLTSLVVHTRRLTLTRLPCRVTIVVTVLQVTSSTFPAGPRGPV